MNKTVIEWSINEPRGFTRCDSESHARRLYEDAKNAELVRTEILMSDDPVITETVIASKSATANR